MKARDVHTDLAVIWYSRPHDFVTNMKPVPVECNQDVSAVDVVSFLSLVAVGAMVQSITGFAMGLIIMGGVTTLGVADIGFSAAVVSILSVVNTTLALRRTYKFIDKVYWTSLVITLLPMIVVGVFVLHYMSSGFYQVLKMVLGIVIISAGGLLMMKPAPFAHRSGSMVVTAIGGIGGLIGGVYGAGGAPIAWLMYRQPVALNAIRATLLATFVVSSTSRTLVIAVTGQLNVQILLIAAASIPIVILVTLTATRVLHRVPDKLVRKVAFVVLVLLGASLILR